MPLPPHSRSTGWGPDCGHNIHILRPTDSGREIAVGRIPLNGVEQQTQRNDRAATDSSRKRILNVAQSARDTKDILRGHKTSDFRCEPDEILT